ncbi:MAG: hypothetical protein AB1938_32615 [Myxococcota bacterium]
MRPLSEDTARALSAHSFGAPAEDTYDAVWLTLEARGYTVTSFDPLTGTFSASRGDGHGYDVTVSAEGEAALVSALPQSARPLWLGGEDGEDRKWAALWAGAAALLETWAHPPEWRYLTRTNTLELPDFGVEPPPAWAYLDYDIHRRRVRVLKRRGAPPGQLNPALLAVVQRRHPVSSLPGLLKEAVGLALTSRARITLPDELHATKERKDTVGGEVRVLDGSVTREVRWHARVRRGPAWEVWLVAACGAGDDSCDDEWSAVLASLERHARAPSVR